MAKELILTVIVKKEQGGYSSWCPELDVASQGDSVEEAKINLKEAVECHVETMVEQGDIDLLLDMLGITKEQLKKKFIIPESFSGTFDIALSI
ncbi:type II toxin-antitoxin system HicB family antitoxin [Candidatus Woesearchaeota archaeon]|nr:type II toxin-antitoxin system HicB family antitoxin [Candidatus Woesearchaeota archaeon]